MFAEERMQRILALLETQPAIRVGELCSLLGASEASIRRDLRKLQETGLLKRTHGGAVRNDLAAFELSMAQKEDRFKAEKISIARVAAHLVRDEETIMLDAGTTTLELARQLNRRRRLTVVTNALNIARELAATQVEVSVTGGSLRRKTLSLVGPLAEGTLAGLHVDKLFLAANGVDLRKGVTTPNLAEARTKRAMVESAAQVIVVADHSKLGRVAFSQVCPIDHVHCLITDAEAPAEFVRTLRRRGVKVLLAGERVAPRGERARGAEKDEKP